VSRAAPLPRAERREAILDAVLPLVVDQGRAISTREIAEACGIAEGTIFRVFTSKSELVDQAIERALSPDLLLAHLAALASDGDLTAVVTDIIAALHEHSTNTHRLLRLLPPLHGALGPHGPHRHKPDAATRREIGEQTIGVLEGLLAPHTDALGVPPRHAAAAVLALGFGSAFSNWAADPAAVAAILLHGIARSDEPKT
jgi:AcrR family transcriptional regulator